MNMVSFLPGLFRSAFAGLERHDLKGNAKDLRVALLFEELVAATEWVPMVGERR